MITHTHILALHITMDPDPDESLNHDESHRRRVIQVSATVGIILLLSINDCLLLYGLHFDKIPQHTSILLGQGWINELIAGHDGRFYNKMGIQKHVFRLLVSVLQNDADLRDTRHVS